MKYDQNDQRASYKVKVNKLKRTDSKILKLSLKRKQLKKLKRRFGDLWIVKINERQIAEYLTEKAAGIYNEVSFDDLSSQSL